MGGMQPRTVALVGLLSLSLGWALGGRTPFTTAGDNQAGRGSSGPRPLGVPPGVSFSPPEPLKLPPPTAGRAPRPERNPFSFGERRAAPAARRELSEAASVSSAPLPAPEAPPAPVLRLTGMATTAGPDGPEFTAMINDGQALVFVKRGEGIAGFTVVDVQETSVTLRDGAGAERTLRLR